MKQGFIAFLFMVAFCVQVAAEPAGPAVPDNLDTDAAELSLQIGSTMFAFYQMHYQDQFVVTATLKYCGREDLAEKVVAALPDLPTFFLQRNPRQLLYDLVNKEAMISGYELKSEEEFELISSRALIQGQAYIPGYLKGYQVAMESFFDKKGMEPFCKAAIVETDTYTKEESFVYQGR